MNKIILTLTLFFLYCSYGMGQISFTGCTGSITAGFPFTLNLSGNDGTRNIYTSALPGPSCSAGVCAFRVIWTGTQWEIQLSNNGGGSFDFTLYTNTTASLPNPPDLTLGVWNASGTCSGQPISTWSGDVQSSTTLPVELLSFEGRQSSENILLNWQTASEINNDKFEIEKSQNGRDFFKIGEMDGIGNSSHLQNYSFKIKSLINGISYYRLKQIDFDGQFEYSEVISVNFKEESGQLGYFYPNPSKSGMVNLDYSAQKEDEITISVFDMTGKLVVNQIQKVSKGQNNLTFDFSFLNKGIYIVKIGDERNPTHRKLIIER